MPRYSDERENFLFGFHYQTVQTQFRYSFKDRVCPAKEMPGLHIVVSIASICLRTCFLNLSNMACIGLHIAVMITSILAAREGGAPQNDFCPSKFFENTIERTIETIAYCFEKQWPIVFCPPYIFSSRKPGIDLSQEILAIDMFSLPKTKDFFPYSFDRSSRYR